MNLFPSISDYIGAVQNPQRAFRNPRLQRAEFQIDRKLGIPMPASGKAAVVFRATIGARSCALRFFLRENGANKQRYDAFNHHFVTRGLRGLIPEARWVEHAIQVRGQWWPVVLMDWIEGRTLDSHVQSILYGRDVSALRTLAATWRKQVGKMQAAEFAHGDLQHGNILIDSNGSIQLVDFDASWIAALRHLPPPSERGHANYQHLGYLWGRWMDTFPALVIYAGLLTLARRPDAWRNNEGILFTRTDLERPGSTPLWQLLGEILDPEVAYVVARLRSCCKLEWSASGSLDDVLERERILAHPIQSNSTAPAFHLLKNPTLEWSNAAVVPPSVETIKGQAFRGVRTARGIRCASTRHGFGEDGVDKMSASVSAQEVLG